MYNSNDTLCAAGTWLYGDWQKQFCNHKAPYICQADPNYVPESCLATTTSVPTGCPAGSCPDPNFTLNPDVCKCYKVWDDDQVDWEMAQTKCQQHNSTLAVILNEKENNFIREYLKWNSPTETLFPAWIGLFCDSGMGMDNACSWIDGSPVTFTHFARKQWNLFETILKNILTTLRQ